MRERILKALVKDGLLTDKQAKELADLEDEEQKSFDRIVREKGWVSEEKLLATIHRVVRIPFERDLAKLSCPADFVERVPVALARTYNLIATERREDDGQTIYRVATCDPFNYNSMDQIASMLEAEVEPVLALRTEISALINRAYQKQGADGVDAALDGIEVDDDLIKIDEDDVGEEDILNTADKGPIIKLVNTIIFDGYRMRASDIHFQPFEHKLQVRYRIDGILYDKNDIDKKFQEAVTGRLKVMSKMDIAERRLPQDGRASCKIGDGQVDIRFNSVPTNYGERIVLRLLDKTARVYRLEDIGLSEPDYKLMSRLIDYQHGVILVTGPTGSGKTTTLYAALSKINGSELNCITIEDPIEYHLPGVSQIQVSSKKGLTFERGLRALLRQDPDVMMVGEIRDQETAKIAIQAALTGHLVFSTVHTNDSASTVTRLVDIGVEPYLVASSVIAVCAQRLVRVICKECSSAYEPTDEELKEIGLSRKDLKSHGTINIGMGCERCLNTGYTGRSAIYELLVIDDAVRDQVMRRVSATEIKDSAIKRGLRTLRMDGARKVVEGLSTIEEVLRVTQLDVN
ncbi:MAG TPA: ATPase, T2SS/T4P/T4SS family [Planctomycetota bacterium]|nr:ATPase, T2SS/T4P/T4SS family [Planctomycetota bacterium]